MNFSKYFPKYIANQIKNPKLIYKGLQNETYIAFFKEKKVQIRIKKNQYVNVENQKKIYKSLNDTIYFKNGNLIKLWFEGQTLENILLNSKIKNLLFKEIKKFHNQKIKNILGMDWYIDEINNDRYTQLLTKYKNDSKVLMHGDLKKKNILINFELEELKLIDFEWSRINDPYFDYVYLHKYLNIDKKKIIKYFDLNYQKFIDFEYIIEVFEIFWFKKYSKK